MFFDASLAQLSPNNIRSTRPDLNATSALQADTDEIKEVVCSQLFCLQTSEHKKLFAAMVEKTIFAEDTSFIKEMPISMPTLKPSIVQFLMNELNKLGLIDLLLYILARTDIYPFKPEEACKLVGSWVFWILGQEYVVEVFEKLGISIYDFMSGEVLQEMFKRPADLDIRINMQEATNVQLTQMGLAIKAYLKSIPLTSSAQISGAKRKPIDNGINCIHILSIQLHGRKVDISLVSKLHNPFLFGEDDLFLTLSQNTLLQSRENAGCDLTIAPEGVLHKGWYAIPLRVTKTKWVQNVCAIDVRGSLKFLFSLINSSTCFFAAHEKRYLHNFCSVLTKDSGPEAAIKMLHKTVNNSRPDQPAAFTAFCFNIYFLLEYHRPDNWEHWARSLFNELREQTKGEEAILQKQNISALHELLKNLPIPFEQLSAFLLVHAQLLECRKLLFRQSSLASATRAESGERPVTHLRFGAEGITLILPADLLQTLRTLHSYFITENHQLSSATAKQLQLVAFPFFQGIAPTHAPMTSSPYYSSEDQELASEMAAIAFNFLECKPLQVIGFSLLCRCGEVQMRSTYIGPLINKLPELLKVNVHPEMRIALLHHFLHYYQKCSSSDSIYQKSEQIKSFCLLLSNGTTTDADVLNTFCRLFSCCHHPEIAVTVHETWKGLSGQIKLPQFIALGHEIIHSYLSTAPKAPNYALPIFISLAKSPQTRFDDLEAKFSAIYTAHVKPNHAEVLALAEAAILLAGKSRLRREQTSQQNYALILIDALLKFSFLDKALQLLDAVDRANCYAELRLKIAVAFFHKGKMEEAFTQWQKAQLYDERAIDILLEWRKLLSNDPQPTLQQLLLRGCTEQLSPEKAQQLLLAIVEELQSELIEQKQQMLPWLRAKGQWLFLQLEIFLQKDHQKYKTGLEGYQQIFEASLLNLRSPENQEAGNLLGAHCFISIVRSFTSACHEDPVDIVANIANEMSNAYSSKLQVVGFSLQCHCDGSKNSTQNLTQLAIALPALAANESSVVTRLALLDIFKKSFPFLFAPLTSHAELIELSSILQNSESSPHDILTAFCRAFAHIDHPAAFDSVYAAYSKLITPSLGMELFNCYLIKQPDKALLIRALMTSRKKNSYKELEGPFNNSCVQLRKETAPLNPEQLSVLVKFAELLLDNAPKNSLLESFKGNLFWLIESLLAILPEEGIVLYKSIESQNLFCKHPEKQHSLQLCICSYYFSSGQEEKAFAFAKQVLSPHNSEELVGLLLAWCAQSRQPQLFELLLLGCDMPLSRYMAGALTAQIMCDMEQKILADHQQGLLESKVNWLINQLKASEDFHQLHQFLIKLLAWKINILPFIESHRLWLILQQAFDAEVSISEFCLEALTEGGDKSKKKVNEDKATFYFYLASRFRDRAFACLRQAFASHGEREISFVHQECIFECLVALLNDRQHEKALLLLKEIKVKLPTANPIRQAEAWKDVLMATQPSLAVAANILMVEAANFAQFELTEVVRPLAMEVSLHLIRQGKTEAQTTAFHIASLYNLLIPSFWKVVLPLLKPESQTGKEMAAKLAGSLNPFGTPSEDASNCWLSLLRLLSKQENTVYIHFLCHYQEIMNELLADKDENRSAESVHLFCSGFISLLSQFQHRSKISHQSNQRNVLDSLLKDIPGLNLINLFLLDPISGDEEFSTILKAINFILASYKPSDSAKMHSTRMMLAEHLLAIESPFCLDKATHELTGLSDVPAKNMKNYGKLVGQAVQQFIAFKMTSGGYIGARLLALVKAVAGSYFRQHDKLTLAEFYAIQPHHELLIDSYELIQNLLEEVATGPKGQLKSDYKQRMAHLLTQALSNDKWLNKRLFLSKLLTEKGILFIFEPAEISRHWAKFFISNFNYARENSTMDNLVEALVPFCAYVDLMTGSSEAEKAAIEGATEILLLLLVKFPQNPFYMETFGLICQKLSRFEGEPFNLVWQDFPKICYRKYLHFSKNELLQAAQSRNICNETSQYMLRFMKKLTPLHKRPCNAEKTSESNLRLIVFIDCLINKTIEYKSDDIAVQATLFGNIYFQMMLLMHFGAKNSYKKYVEMIHSLIQSLAMRFAPSMGVFNFQFSMALDLLSLAQLPSNKLLFEMGLLELFQNDYIFEADFSAKFPRQQQQVCTVQLIKRLCSQRSSPLNVRALHIVWSVQSILFGDSPALLKECYETILDAAQYDPFCLVGDRTHSPSDNAEGAPDSPQEEKLTPFIYAIGKLLIKCCLSKGLSSLESSPEMQEAVKELFYKFFQLTLKCQGQSEAGFEIQISRINITPQMLLHEEENHPLKKIVATRSNCFNFLLHQVSLIKQLSFVKTDPSIFFTLLEMLMPLAVLEQEVGRNSFISHLVSLPLESLYSVAAHRAHQTLFKKWTLLLKAHRIKQDGGNSS